MKQEKITIENEELKSQESILREQIKVIESIPTGVVGKAGAVLVCYGEKPAVEMYFRSDITQDEVFQTIESLRNVGLCAEIIERSIVGIAKSSQVLDKLKQARPNKNHQEYGELMGFPQTAIDAFLGKTERLGTDEQDELTNELPHVLNGFIFSKEHAKEELIKLTRWLRTIAKYAPELIEQLYSKERADKFKKYLLEDKGRV